jgi:hypothetical protein
MTSLCLRVCSALLLSCFSLSAVPSLVAESLPVAATDQAAGPVASSTPTPNGSAPKKPGAAADTSPAGAKPGVAGAAPAKKADDPKAAADTPAASPPPKPSVTEAYAYPLAAGATRVASLLQDLSIVGVGQVLATGDKNLVFLLDRQALIKSLSKKPADSGDAAIAALKVRLAGIANALSTHSPTRSVVIGLPTGAKATDFATSAMKIIGVTTATPIGDTDILITYDAAVQDAADFVKKLEQPLPPDKRVESATQRLYYMSGADAGPAVATVINNMYPDVAAAFLAPDMIQLSMRNLPSGLKRYQTDTIDDARRAIAKVDQPRPRASLDCMGDSGCGRTFGLARGSDPEDRRAHFGI